MAVASQVPVNEKRRQVVFDTGERLDLHNVVSFDPSGTTLRIWSEEGMTIIYTDRVLYQTVKADLRRDDQEAVRP